MVSKKSLLNPIVLTIYHSQLVQKVKKGLLLDLNNLHNFHEYVKGDHNKLEDYEVALEFYFHFQI